MNLMITLWADCWDPYNLLPYTGTQSWGRGGSSCVPWKQSPTAYLALYKDVSYSACRNPEGEPNISPWCWGPWGERLSCSNIPQCRSGKCMANRNTLMNIFNSLSYQHNIGNKTQMMLMFWMFLLVVNEIALALAYHPAPKNKWSSKLDRRCEVQLHRKGKSSFFYNVLGIVSLMSFIFWGFCWIFLKGRMSLYRRYLSFLLTQCNLFCLFS